MGKQTVNAGGTGFQKCAGCHSDSLCSSQGACLKEDYPIPAAAKSAGGIQVVDSLDPGRGDKAGRVLPTRVY